MGGLRIVFAPIDPAHATPPLNEHIFAARAAGAEL
jgi:hypothetical protein